MIQSIQHKGILLHECSVPGETRAEDRYPGNANGLQVSRDRFMMVYTTRGYRGTDDNLSVIWQLRDGSYDGPVISEGRVVESIDDWDPLDTGISCVRAHLHPVAFGVPKGAVIDGRPAPHSNLFVLKWIRKARYIDPGTGYMPNVKETDPWLQANTECVEWAQLRLNDREDEMEVVQPVGVMRQRGFESAYAFCDADVQWMSQTFTQPVPFNEDATEWVDFNFFNQKRIAAIRYAFNATRGVYEWVQTGPLISGGLVEGSVHRYDDAWVISARTWSSVKAPRGGPVAWMRTRDPFDEVPEIVYPPEPNTTSPLTSFVCADGVLRLITNDLRISPYGHHRNPLYCWDIDPDQGFAASNVRVIFDSKKAGVPIRPEAGICIDQAKVLPHAGGDTQYVIHRVRPVAINDPKKIGVQINDQDKEPAGNYYAAFRYTEAYPGQWSF